MALNPDNDRFRDFLGVKKWHEAGYTGNVLVASGEEWSRTDKTDHGYKTAAVLREIAPDAVIVSVRPSSILDDEHWALWSDAIRATAPVVWWSSVVTSVYRSAWESNFRAAAERCAIITAAGNRRETPMDRACDSPFVIGVKAANLLFPTRQIQAVNYNYDDSAAALCGFAGLWVGNEHFVGTSCAAPVVAGLAALVQQKAIQDIGRALSSVEMERFLLANAVTQNGCTIPVLPEPESVQFEEYIDHESDGEGMNIIEHDWKWQSPLYNRGITDTLVLHHAAAVNCSPEQIHASHLAKGWSGIGYHYFVRKNGEIHRGRPEGMEGAHVLNHNWHTLGICFEGSYDIEANMPSAQFEAGRALIADILMRYPKIKVCGHRDMIATVCPGGHFPLDEITKGEKDMTKDEVKAMFDEFWLEKMNDNSAAPAWMQNDEAWARAKADGITDGTHPNAPCTRGQAAVMVARAMGGKQ